MKKEEWNISKNRYSRSILILLSLTIILLPSTAELTSSQGTTTISLIIPTASSVTTNPSFNTVVPPVSATADGGDIYIKGQGSRRATLSVNSDRQKMSVLGTSPLKELYSPMDCAIFEGTTSIKRVTITTASQPLFTTTVNNEEHTFSIKYYQDFDWRDPATIGVEQYAMVVTWTVTST
jgi:hypothetical protein